MSDRVYTVVHVHGPIMTTDALDALCTAIAADMHDRDLGLILAELLKAMETSTAAVFEDEILHADISTIEQACVDHGIAFVAYHDDGDDFGSGSKAYEPSTMTKVDHCETTSEGVAVPLSEFVSLFDSGSIDEARAQALLDRYSRLDGVDFPPFPVSDEVRARLTGQARKAA